MRKRIEALTSVECRNGHCDFCKGIAGGNDGLACDCPCHDQDPIPVFPESQVSAMEE